MSPQATAWPETEAQREFLSGNAGASLRATYFSDPIKGAEPFAFLHRPV